jgi:hypothetical protein
VQFLPDGARLRSAKSGDHEEESTPEPLTHLTHPTGLLAGESEAILKAKAEPALILTPPKDGTPASELDEDDDLLAASEVSQLELDADRIVLSACNTAAGDKGDDAEALSGLARAWGSPSSMTPSRRTSGHRRQRASAQGRPGGSGPCWLRPRCARSRSVPGPVRRASSSRSSPRKAVAAICGQEP